MKSTLGMKTNDCKLSTEEFAELMKVKPATIRRGYWDKGHYLNIKPLKLPNRLLYWPEADVLDLLGSEA